MCLLTLLYNRCGHVETSEWTLCRRFARSRENPALEPCTTIIRDEWFDEDACRDCEARWTRARGRAGPTTGQSGGVGGDAEFERKRREAHPWRIVVRVERVGDGGEEAAAADAKEEEIRGGGGGG